MAKKLKKKLKAVEAELREIKRLVQAICHKFEISTRLGGVTLTSFDDIVKKLYPAEGFSVAPARKELDQEARIARAEEIAAKMFEEQDNKLPNKYETIVESITFEEEKPEAKVRIPPNLSLGF